MTNKDLIYKKMLELNPSNGIDTQTLASLLNMKRTNVSHELNVLCKEGKIKKSNTRPVLFFLTETTEYQNKKTKLDQLSHNNISLKQAIEQAKAAILYPPKGMNCLILGPTGVGKSMFASLMHDYAIKMGVKPENSPFIIFNCADYSNNPQLLTSQLFGVKKGAYTGSENDKVGLIEEANGGILFLDEIHRLPPEGQEALFVFLDTGTFRRIGDSETRSSDVLIFAATTEDPDSALLDTFARRIPITIKIPALKDRTFEERFYLIKSFFKHESIRLNREIYVSLNSLRALLSYDCKNNIGQLKSDVQLICAKAYSEFLTNVRQDIRISSRILPLYIKDGLYKEKEHRVLWNKLMGEEVEYFRFSGSSISENYISNSNDSTIYNFLENKLRKLKSESTSPILIEDILEKDISRYFEKYIAGVSDDINIKNLTNLIEPDVLKILDEVIIYIHDNFNIKLENNIYIAFALHINTLISRIYNNKLIINQHLAEIKELYPSQFSIALKIKQLIEKHIHLHIPEDEAGYLTLFLTPETPLFEKNTDKVKVILIAHGDATASSMVNVANTLLGENYAIPINAPLNEKPFMVLEKLRTVVKNNPTSKGYLLLVDMGSLTTFADVISKEFNVPVKVISLVSTLHILEATRKALLGANLDELYNNVLMVNSYIEIHKNLKEHNIYDKKYLIVTSCLTGDGGAIAIKNFLKNTLSFNSDLFEIINLDCLDKNYFKEKLLSLKKENEILFIVSSFKIDDIGIKQYSMSDVFDMNVAEELQNLIDTKTSLINVPNIINENIPNLNGQELFNDLCEFIDNICLDLSLSLTGESTVGLILHLAFVIGRLRIAKAVTTYPDNENFIKENINVYNSINKNFEFLNNKYSIKISDHEICYIIKLLTNC